MADWRGIFTIPQTPFDLAGRLDEESLQREVEFCVRAGAHGLVGPVVASEFFVLTDDERRRFARILVEQARRRVPVIVGVTAASREQAVAFSREAEALGADGVIAMPPHVLKAGREGARAYYQAISDSIGLPVMIQNAGPPLGSALPPAFIVQLCREIDRLEYVKEEAVPSGHAISAILKEAEPRVRGVFGGTAARWMLPELDRGACGFMPGCPFTDVYVQIWDLWEAGDREAARALFNKLLPLINLGGMLGISLVKEALVRRGLIAHAAVRQPDAVSLDDYDRRELQRGLEDLQPYFKAGG